MEYRSSAEWLGLPLIHIATGGWRDGEYCRGVAIGWIAIGDVAVGVFLALGGIAIGGVSLGGLSLGALGIGGVALGIAGVGGFSLGVVAMGGVALGGYAAVGGVAVARDYALGGVALARHALSSLSQLSTSRPPIPHPPFRESDALLLLAVIVALVLVAREVQNRKRSR